MGNCLVEDELKDEKSLEAVPQVMDNEDMSLKLDDSSSQSLLIEEFLAPYGPHTGLNAIKPINYKLSAQRPTFKHLTSIEVLPEYTASTYISSSHLLNNEVFDFDPIFDRLDGDADGLVSAGDVIGYLTAHGGKFSGCQSTVAKIDCELSQAIRLYSKHGILSLNASEFKEFMVDYSSL